MSFPLILIYIFAVNVGQNIVLTENCDKYGVLIYEDLGCVPEYDNPQGCPVKYKCNGLKSWNNECHFKGKTYRNSELVENEISLLSCDVACFCNAREQFSRFICAVLDCPEWLGKPTSPGCHWRYSLDDCCAVGEVCSSSPNLAKCVVDGIEYKEGQRFYPKDSCVVCVCQKGFKGVLQPPFCRRQSCGAQLKRGGEIQKNCAPIYRKYETENLCCPIDWFCPEENDVSIPPKKIDKKQEGNFCKFGSNYLKVGENLKSSKRGIICECRIPPLLTCVSQ